MSNPPTTTPFYALMLATMMTDANYYDSDEEIREIHVENYTEDLAAAIEAGL